MHGLALLMCRSYKYPTEISNLLLSRQIVFFICTERGSMPSGINAVLYFLNDLATVMSVPDVGDFVGFEFRRRYFQMHFHEWKKL